ncbi:4Fe-4S dicluster domain-containing protein [Geoglobus ahangari]
MLRVLPRRCDRDGDTRQGACKGGWGSGILRVLNLGNKDVELIDELGKEGGDIKRCIQCGACMSICPVAISGFEFPNKRLFKLIILEMGEEVLEHKSPWICVSCHRCVDVCPRDVDPHSIYFALRRLQSKYFRHPKVFEDLVRRIHAHGFCVESTDSERRRTLGLNELRMDEESLEEVREILTSGKLRDLGVVR